METVYSWLLMADRTDHCVSILKCGTNMWQFKVDRSINGRRSLVFFQNQEQPAVVPERSHVADPFYGPLQQQSVHGLLEVLTAVLGPEADALMGELRSSKESDVHPSSTVLVARQVPGRLLHCGTKSARRAPTWTPSKLSSWGSWRSCPSLLALLRVASMAGSSAGAGTKGLLLSHGPLHSGGCRRTQTVKHRSPGLVLLGWWSHFPACLALLGLLDKGHWRARHPVCLPDGLNTVLQNLGFRTQDMRTLEWSRPLLTQYLRLKTEVPE